MMATTRSRIHMEGFSLVELLVAMTLGLLLTSGMISVFAGNRASSEFNAAIANMQEGARYALDAIAADARNAGFQGCLGVQSGATEIRAKNAPTASYIDSAASGSVIGTDDDWNPDPPPGLVEADNKAVPGTHAVSLQFGDSDTRLLRQQMKSGGVPSPSGLVWVDEPLAGAGVGDFAIVSNCERADLFAISGFAKNVRGLRHRPSHNTNGNLSASYGDDRTIGQTLVMLFRSNVYYVGDTGRDNDSGDDIHALYRQTLPYGDPVGNPPTELVAGVENLRVAFGIRESTGNLRYLAPDSTDFDAARVESIRIGILMTSRERIASVDDSKTYELAGQLIPPAPGKVGDLAGDVHAVDRRHRLAFNTTVKVRNRRFRR